jgi:hypothetical protein
MAIRKLDRSFVPNTKEIRYLNKTWSQYRQSLIDFAKVYYPNTYADFNESSPGMMFIEMMAYVGDVLGYYIDTQFRENLIQYAEESDNIIGIAQSLGFKPKPATAAYTMLDIYQLCPANDELNNFEVDERYLLKLAPNTIVSSTEYGGITFRTITETNFADPTDREITIYAVNAWNQPLTYLVRKRVKVVAGNIKTYTATFGAPEKFSKLTLPDDDVLEIVSVIDSNGFKWFEVDYLAQDLILTEKENTNPTIAGQSVPPTYIIKVTRTPRRFVTRYDDEFRLELHFGSGVVEDTDSTIDLSPSKIATDEYENSLASTSLDPSDFLSSRSYGLAPANLEMIVTYSTGGGLATNVPSNSINKVNTFEVLNDRSVFSTVENSLFDEVVSSLAVNNSDPATGGKDRDSVEEIRQNALAFFNSQNRLVNSKDYAVRVYAMPAKFGSVAKAFVAQDAQINGVIEANSTAVPEDGRFVVDNIGQNVVNLYVLGYDRFKRLTTLNQQVKSNLRSYLDQYRMLTDEIRILDAFVVNIGIDFKIVVFKSYNLNEVLARAIDAVKDFFNIDRWQINQPIIIADLYNTIASIDGVQSVTHVRVVNKYQFEHGADYNDYIYDIDAATVNGIIYPSLDPCIFEIKYPDNDIVGTAVQ